METKVCNKCNKKKNIEDFPHEKRNNKIYIRLQCKTCTNKNKLPNLIKYRASLKGKLTTVKYKKHFNLKRREQIKNLDVSYLKDVLYKINIPITPEFINIKREQLLYYRKTNNSKHGTRTKIK